jgi:hypothetical protein
LNKFYAILTLVLLGGGGLGCAYEHARFDGAGDNVPFARSEYTYPEDGFQDKRRPGVFRVALDAEGSIYPDPALRRIDDRAFEAADFLLETYFAGQGDYDPDEVAAGFARQISGECAGGKSLVILVHGMNNSYSEARRAYDLARRVIRDEVPGRGVVFLEVYWDALHGGPLAIWPKVREGSKWVGLGLRRLLSKIDRSVPVRFLAHSRGASVVSAALWNVPLREGGFRDEKFERSARRIPTPSPASLRLGLLVPAMPDEDFSSFFDRSAGDAGSFADVRVILGVNEDDPALSKGPFGPDFWGSTAAGCRADRFARTIAPALNKTGEIASIVDLSASEIHDFKDYLLRRAFLEEFLPRLFERDLAQGTGEAARLDSTLHALEPEIRAYEKRP